jgi:hypothetical protein
MTLPLVTLVDLKAGDFDGSLTPVPAHVAACTETSAGERHTPIVKVTFAYESPPGFQRTGVSYLAAECPAVGSALPAEHAPGRPERVRLVGGRSAPFDTWLLFILGLPALGLGFLLTGLVRGWNDLRLLRRGLLAMGAVTGKERTSTSVNQKPVWAFRLRLASADGATHASTARTHLVDRLEGEGVPLLYAPWKPAQALPLALLGRRTAVDPAGRVVGGSALGALKALAWPAIMVVVLCVVRGWLKGWTI